MTHKVGNTIVIEATAPANCSACDKVDELRPYGKDGAWVCFECGMKDEAGALGQFNKIFGVGRDI